MAEVDAELTRIAGLEGKGSQTERARALRTLFARCSAGEREFLAPLLAGELRQGALEGLMIEAIARGSGLPGADVRRAVMLAGDLGAGRARRVRARRRRPRRVPARAASARSSRCSRRPPADPAEALAALGGRCAFEWKLDGARVQVHRSGDDVRIFTRGLLDGDRLGARARRAGRAPCRRRHVRARRRGDRVPRRRPPAAVPGDDAPLRPAPRRRERSAASCRSKRASSTACTATARTLIDRPARGALAHRSTRASRSRTASRASSPESGAEAEAFLADALAARPRGRDGEGARRALRGGPPRRRAGSSSSPRTRSTSSCSPSSGAAAAARACSRTCTSARATRRPAASSCSARRSRA